MPMTFSQLMERTKERMEESGSQGVRHLAFSPDLEGVVLAVLGGLDFSVDRRTGEVVDPRPAPSIMPRNQSWRPAKRRR